ncbi:MAG: hypothetical protein H6R21_3349 [Proteobacteria bacterium]|nr:hypothetical protein [Pseudomonadota bacterium]
MPSPCQGQVCVDASMNNINWANAARLFEAVAAR